MLTIPHLRGDTLSLVARIPSKFVDGFFVGSTVEAHVRAASGRQKVATMSVEWVDPVTTRHLYIRVDDTTTWPTGACRFDIQFTSPTGGVISCDPIGIRVSRDITYASPV